MAKPRNTKPKANGLGDTIESVTKATGLDKLAKFILGKDCGCEERKHKLNALFPYKKANCLNENDYNYLTVLFEGKLNTLSIKQQQDISGIYLRTFNTNIHINNCPSCWRDYIANLRQVYASY